MTLKNELGGVLSAFAAFRGAGAQPSLHAFHLAPGQGLIQMVSQGPDSDVILPWPKLGRVGGRGASRRETQPPGVNPGGD